MKKIKILLFLLSFSGRLFSATFTEVTAVVFPRTKPELRDSAAAWGDFNNDGYWDLVVCGRDRAGSPKTLLYKNTGRTGGYKLKEISHPFIDVWRGDVVWFDYNNDGYIDLLIGGTTGTGEKARIYRNNGNETFTDSGINIGNYLAPSFSVGDYNNDGMIDIALMGSGRTRIYRNTGRDFVKENFVSIIGTVDSGDIIWVDLNNDGWLDLVQVGIRQVGEVREVYSAVYRNDKTNFSIVNKLDNLVNGALAVADYDNDGDFDIVLTGADEMGENRRSRIYENIGNMKFSTNTFTPGVGEGSLHWGDVDNNGIINLAVTGVEDDTTPPILRCNISSFTTIISTITAGESQRGSVTFVDYDNDKDLDLFVCGQDRAGNPVGKLFRNDSKPNKIPPRVVDFNSRYFNDKLYIMWNDPLQGIEETPPSGWYYNFRVGSSSGIDNLVPARYGSPLLGNYLTKVTSSTIDDVDIAARNVDVSGYKHVRVLNIRGPSYYWAVQTIDTSLGFSWASPFDGVWSEQQVFKDTTPPTGLPTVPTDDGERTYNKDLTFNWTKGTADDPETGIYGCYIEIKEIDEAGVERRVVYKDISNKLTRTVWGPAGNASYIHTGTPNKTYKIRVKARHGYDQSIPTETYKPDDYGGVPGALWHPDSPHYTRWTNWSDGIKIIELLTINNNLIRNPGAGGDAVEIGYSLLKDGQVIIRIFNVLGELVRTVIDKYVIKGEEKVEKWYGVTDNNKIVASGVYYINIQAAGSEDTQKVVVVK